jgi:hypothetical protein
MLAQSFKSSAYLGTPAQAATALRSYLTTGDAKWHEAVGT